MSQAPAGHGGRVALPVHPVAWWVWAIGVAAFASQTTNPWLSLLPSP